MNTFSNKFPFLILSNLVLQKLGGLNVIELHNIGINDSS